MNHPQQIEIETQFLGDNSYSYQTSETTFIVLYLLFSYQTEIMVPSKQKNIWSMGKNGKVQGGILFL